MMMYNLESLYKNNFLNHAASSNNRKSAVTAVSLLVSISFRKWKGEKKEARSDEGETKRMRGKTEGHASCMRERGHDRYTYRHAIPTSRH